jgi:hypothetical protein
MVVKTQSKGLGRTGVNVGASNARRYFSRDTAVVELELDHLRIQCWLKPGFWLDQPEIDDPRLCAWLESKRLQTRPNQPPVPLAMIPAGKNAFRLQPVAMHAQHRAKPARGPVGLELIG